MGQHINVFHANEAGKLIAYHRWDAGGSGDDVVVVANFANSARQAYTIGFPHNGAWRVRFNSDLRRYAAEFGNARCPDVIAAEPPQGTGADGMPAWGNIAVGPIRIKLSELHKQLSNRWFFVSLVQAAVLGDATTDPG